MRNAAGMRQSGNLQQTHGIRYILIPTQRIGAGIIEQGKIKTINYL
jgi:hypothetical protein